MFRFHAMIFEGDQSCYDFPVLFVLIFLAHSTSLLVLFLNYFIREYIWKHNAQRKDGKINLKQKNGYLNHEKDH